MERLWVHGAFRLLELGGNDTMFVGLDSGLA